MISCKTFFFQCLLALKSTLLFLLLSQYAIADSSLWVKSWYNVPTDKGGLMIQANSTLRQTITPNASGNKVRLRFSNVLGTEDIVIKNVTISQQSAMAGALSGSFKTLTFAGASTGVIPKGGYLTSDPVSYDIIALQRYHITFVPLTTTLNATRHARAYEAPYVSFHSMVPLPIKSLFLPVVDATKQSWVLIESLDVISPVRKQVVMALGDSITDGDSGDLDLYIHHPAFNTGHINTRYTDYLAQRLDAANINHLVVLNAGIGGNRLDVDATDRMGPSVLTRLQRDVLDVPNLRTVILLAGINDLFRDKNPGAGQRVINNLDIAVKRLRAEGVNVVLGTLTSTVGMTRLSMLVGFTDPNVAEVERQLVNKWIRTQNVANSVVDFDQCLSDPQYPLLFLPAYNSGDAVHPSAKGRKAMASCIDLNSL